jgi:murein DD-endopeptidase MepM/ murein hydrolase activator NlpD
MATPTKKKRFFQRLKNKYKLVVMNEQTFEENASFSLRPLNVFVAAGVIILLLITLTTFIIAFTPLREYIPGYADLTMQRRVYMLAVKADSMEKALNDRDLYIQNINNVISGNIASGTEENKKSQGAKYDTIHALKKSISDSMLRKEIESQDQYTLGVKENAAFANSMSGFLFFPPLKGTVTSRYDPVTKHFGIDVVANANEAVKSTLDGTVVIANFTSETGYVIGIQHSNNLFSFYKHNSSLLKKTGDFVKAGEVIAIIGNSGELSTGPHLHFELWYNGTALDPQKYILF